MKSRLNEIKTFIENDYTEIWDTCCDHGKLGISLLKSTTKSKIHFVDCVPNIMKGLETKLGTMGLLVSSRVSLHTINAEQINLSEDKSLICICGVGSITAIDIIRGILKNNNLNTHDLILCVQYKTPKLRQFLIDNNFKIQKETLFFEGKWPHEILRISLNKGEDIDLIGSTMFDLKNDKHLNYINKSISHYHKKNLVDSSYTKILDLYKKVLI